MAWYAVDGGWTATDATHTKTYSNTLAIVWLKLRQES